MYPSHNSEKVIHELLLRELEADARLYEHQGLLARLQRWLAARRERNAAAEIIERPSQTYARTNVLTLK